jgi:hypothetical protein
VWRVNDADNFEIISKDYKLRQLIVITYVINE